MTIQDILDQKGRKVVSVPPGSPILEAVRLLARENVGSAVVIDSDAMVGIVTERDILRLVARNPEALPTLTTAAVMTRSVLVGHLDDPVPLVMETMARRRIRHLPVTEGGRLVGIVSMGDVVKAGLELVVAETRDLRQYAAVFLEGDTSRLSGHDRRPSLPQRRSVRPQGGRPSEVTAGGVLLEKGTSVVTVEPSTSMHATVEAMHGHDIGSVLVTEGDDVHGILTERDVLRCAARDPHASHKCAVREHMSGGLVVCRPEDTLGEMLDVMTRRRIRHLPVMGGQGLEGILSMRDLVRAYLKAARAENRDLRDRIHGRDRESA